MTGAYQDDIRTELLNGQIVAMSPWPSINHNIVSGNLFYQFRSYLRGKQYVAFADGVEVYLTEDDHVIPDVMVVCNRDIVKPNRIYGAPDLIVEILSPSTAKQDRGYKRDLYARCGVKEYWIVSIEARSIEVYLLKDGQYQLDNLYTMFPQYMLDSMPEEERRAIPTSFRPHILPEMNIDISEVFENLFNI